MSSLKEKQPKKPPPKRTRNVGKSKHVKLTTSSSTESPPSDNRDLPSTKLSLRFYSRALKDDPNIYKEQRKTRGMFKNLGRALHNFARMLMKGCYNAACMLACSWVLAANYSSGTFLHDQRYSHQIPLPSSFRVSIAARDDSVEVEIEIVWGPGNAQYLLALDIDT
ncbi:hypothetical protein Tco_0620845 [Tanacetum coccineum]